MGKPIWESVQLGVPPPALSWFPSFLRHLLWTKLTGETLNSHFKRSCSRRPKGAA